MLCDYESRAWNNASLSQGVQRIAKERPSEREHGSPGIV